MCGINGIFAYHSAASAPAENELLITRDAMRLRGPDGSGAWWNSTGVVPSAIDGFRLSTFQTARLNRWRVKTAVSWSCSMAKSTTILNFEPNSRPRGRVSARPPIPRCSCISTRATAARWCMVSVACLPSPYGMQPRRGLFLARDPYGIKPLYTANDGWTFRFASQVKALLAGGNVSTRS